MSTNNAAGYVGKFGSANYTSLSRSADQAKLPPRPQSKFFKSRNPLPISEDIIEELEEDEEADEAWTTLDKENVSTNISNDISSTNVSSSNNSTVVPAGRTPLPPPADHLKVTVRVRPTLGSELASEELVVQGSQTVVRGKVCRFDTVLGPAAGQEELYRRAVQPLVDQLATEDACNAIVFAYGPTGAGKTHTMGTGLEQGPDTGVLPRALAQVLEQARDQDGQVTLAFYEIHKDETSNKPKVFDLLAGPGGKEPILVKLDKAAAAVPGLSEVAVTGPEQAMELVRAGTKLRATEATARNARSSRSHAVTVITVDTAGSVRRLSLVDLAGSEASGRTKASGSRAAEGTGINESLLHLGNVIRALAEKKAYIPYRDTPLTWVLRDSLSPSCLISMVFCVSPAAADLQETTFTLDFAEQAKRLKVQPVPAHLLAGRNTPNLSFRTPRVGAKTNQTIHSTTPSKGSKRPGAPLNRTIGTPGKRARSEQRPAFVTPQLPGRGPQQLTSTVQQLARSRARGDNRLLDVSQLGISVIEPRDDGEETVAGPSGTAAGQGTLYTEADITTMMEPMMKQMTETMGSMVGSMITEQMEKIQAALISTKPAARTPARASTRTPGRRAPSRATSSPKALQPLARRETVNSPRDMLEDDSLVEPTAIEVVHEVPEEEDEEGTEDIISGTGVVLGPGPGHRRVDQIMSSASPELQRYTSPPSSSRAAASSSPSVEEMERMLGINSDSPGANDLFETTTASTSAAGGAIRKFPKKSVRRTTMLSSEIRDTLADIQNLAAVNPNRRRSTRVESRAVFYGSPSELARQKETETEPFKHPVMVKEAWKVPAGRQRHHNNNILTLLNTANISVLTKLPAVGPKSAYVLQQYRDLNDGIKTIQEIKEIPGLAKGFYDRFCLRNQVQEVENEEG